MKFRAGYLLRGVSPERASDLPSTVQINDTLEIRLFESPPEEGASGGTLCIEGIESFTADEALHEFFDGLSKGRLPNRFHESVELPIKSSRSIILDRYGILTPGHAFPRSAVPDFAKRIISERILNIRSKIGDFFTTLRWLQNASGPHSPFSSLESHFSIAGDEWHRLPTESKLTIHATTLLTTNKEALAEAKELFRKGETEPAYHLLLREAYELSRNSPRSALLIAIAALEIGAKELTFFLCPGSDIILEDIQSPPILKFLNEKIPRLLKKRRPSMETVFLPLEEHETKLLKKWITQRNHVAHAGKKHINIEELLDLLDLVNRILYTIDAIRGHEWALKNLNRNDQRLSVGFM